MLVDVDSRDPSWRESILSLEVDELFPFGPSRPTLFDRCRWRNLEVKPNLDFVGDGCGDASRECRVEGVSEALPDLVEESSCLELDNDSSTIFGIGSLSASRCLSRTALTRIPDCVTAVALTDVRSPTPTLFSHHCSIALTPDAAGGHLYTRNAVPSSTQYTRRHLRSLACTPGCVNSTFLGITPAR